MRLRLSDDYLIAKRLLEKIARTKEGSKEEKSIDEEESIEEKKRQDNAAAAMEMDKEEGEDFADGEESESDVGR